MEGKITYEEFINNILNTRGRFNCGNEYCERHHILPKCMGGTNDKDNLIDLYAREHFIAHKLLVLENPDNNSLVYAYSMMAFPKNNNQNRYELSPEEYEMARKMLSSIPKSEEHRRKISEANKGKVRSEETIQKIKKSKQNISDETRQKLSNSAKERFANPENCTMYGKHHSEESKQKMSETRRGMHCGKDNSFYGKTHTDETKEKLRIAGKLKFGGQNNPFYGSHRTKGTNPNARMVIRLSDEKIYECVLDSAEDNHMDRHTITKRCKAHKDFMYYDEWLEQQSN